MKWIFWGIWCVLCLIGMAFKLLGYLCCNIFLILWEFKLSSLITWKDYTEWEEYYMNSLDDFGLRTMSDENPWKTYKRWAFL